MIIGDLYRKRNYIFSVDRFCGVHDIKRRFLLSIEKNEKLFSCY